MKRLALCGLLLLLPSVWAQQPRAGGEARVYIDEGAPGNAVMLELQTDPERTGKSELMVYAYRRERDTEGGLLRRLTPPEAPGLYRLELTLPEAGDWGFTLRYGLGLNLYYASVSQRLEPEGDAAYDYVATFRGDLAQEAPPYVQPLGFGVFALVAAGVIALITTILRWLGAQRRTGVGLR